MCMNAWNDTIDTDEVISQDARTLDSPRLTQVRQPVFDREIHTHSAIIANCPGRVAGDLAERM